MTDPMTALDSYRWDDIIKVIKIKVKFVYFKVTMRGYQRLFVGWNYLSSRIICRPELSFGWNYSNYFQR